MATSKSKKIETPVDHYETFVSLRKTFADSEQGIQDKLKTLYQLQKADNEIESLVQLRGELPAEVEAVENEVEALKSKISHINDIVSESLNFIDASTRSIVAHDEEIAKYESMKTNISNSREFDSIEKEIENHNYERQIDEKNINETKLKIERFKEDIEALNGKLSIRTEDLNAKKSELEDIIASTSAKEEEMKARRDALAAELDERTISAYDRIRLSNRNHLAVVPLYADNACGGCFNTVTPQRRIDILGGKKLVICEHCGRIIVNPEI